MERNCEFCEVSKTNFYTCPKCNAVYCSLKCYQSPNHVQCSEAFYKGCVEQEMRLINKQGPSKDSLKKTYEALARVNDQPDLDDSDDDDDLATRLEGVDLNDTDALWEKLTDSEKTEFQSLVKTGEIGKFVPKYQPWWDLHFNSKSKVQELKQFEKEVADFEKEIAQKVPKVDAEIGKMTDFMGDRKPAQTVKFGLINVLYAYAFCQRFFHGEVEPENLSEYVDLCLRISGNLRQPPQNFDSAELALESAVDSVVQNGSTLETSQQTAKSIKKDVFKLIRGSGSDTQPENLYLLAAISDLKANLVKFQQTNKKSPIRKEVKLAIKKLDFYLAWITEFFHCFKN